jgi:hypothetical protein
LVCDRHFNEICKCDATSILINSVETDKSNLSYVGFESKCLFTPNIKDTEQLQHLLNQNTRGNLVLDRYRYRMLPVIVKQQAKSDLSLILFLIKLTAKEK